MNVPEEIKKHLEKKKKKMASKCQQIKEDSYIPSNKIINDEVYFIFPSKDVPFVCHPASHNTSARLNHLGNRIFRRVITSMAHKFMIHVF